MPHTPLPPSPPQIPRPRTEVNFSFTGVLLIIAMTAAISAFMLYKEGFLGSKHPRISLVKADLHSLAIGIEASYTDLGSYPPALPLSPFTAKQRHRRELDAMALTTVGPGLTTPVAYLTQLFTDSLSQDFGELPFAYWPQGSGWIAWSAGPDGVYQIRPTAEFYDPAQSKPLPALIDATYDPTPMVRRALATSGA